MILLAFCLAPPAAFADGPLTAPWGGATLPGFDFSDLAPAARLQIVRPDSPPPAPFVPRQGIGFASGLGSFHQQSLTPLPGTAPVVVTSDRPPEATVQITREPPGPVPGVGVTIAISMPQPNADPRLLLHQSFSPVADPGNLIEVFATTPAPSGEGSALLALRVEGGTAQATGQVAGIAAVTGAGRYLMVSFGDPGLVQLNRTESLHGWTDERDLTLWRHGGAVAGWSLTPTIGLTSQRVGQSLVQDVRASLPTARAASAGASILPSMQFRDRQRLDSKSAGLRLGAEARRTIGRDTDLVASLTLGLTRYRGTARSYSGWAHGDGPLSEAQTGILHFDQQGGTARVALGIEQRLTRQTSLSFGLFGQVSGAVPTLEQNQGGSAPVLWSDASGAPTVLSDGGTARVSRIGRQTLRQSGLYLGLTIRF